jgi:hypothetical protein
MTLSMKIIIILLMISILIVVQWVAKIENEQNELFVKIARLEKEKANEIKNFHEFK